MILATQQICGYFFCFKEAEFIKGRKEGFFKCLAGHSISVAKIDHDILREKVTDWGNIRGDFQRV
jgi:hypothetical protein